MPQKRESLIGCRFGKLLVIADAPRKWRQTYYACRCDCGTETITTDYSLSHQRVTRCWKCRRAAMGRRNATHNLSYSRIYSIWHGMVNRCRNKNCESYAHYGGRGIVVCERWLRFENFFSDMGHPEAGKTLERINNNGNYELANCRWATIAEQNRNRSDSRILTVHGITGCVAELCRHFAVPYARTLRRLSGGCATEAAFRKVDMRSRVRASKPKNVNRKATGKRKPRTPTYESWSHMRQRCGNPNNIGYAYYGGRGITVDPGLVTFQGFLAEMGPRPRGTSLGRINNEKGYCKGNCEWQTPFQQARNRRDRQMVTVRGVTGLLSELCRHYRINFSCVWRRLQYGWTPEQALVTPIQSGGCPRKAPS